MIEALSQADINVRSASEEEKLNGDLQKAEVDLALERSFVLEPNPKNQNKYLNALRFRPYYWHVKNEQKHT